MGDIADMMIDGTLDCETGEFLDGDSPGYPRTAADLPKKKKKRKKRSDKDRKQGKPKDDVLTVITGEPSVEVDTFNNEGTDMTEYYATEERAMAPGIAGDWPDVIPKPDSPHGRLVKYTDVDVDGLIAKSSGLLAWLDKEWYGKALIERSLHLQWLKKALRESPSNRGKSYQDEGKLRQQHVTQPSDIPTDWRKHCLRLWVEDDTNTPDREKTAKACLRITGIEHDREYSLIDKIDEGDEIVYFLYGGWVVAFNYDGGWVGVLVESSS